MGFGDRRERRQQERREFGAGGSAVRYQMRQKLVSFGDDYWIENEGGDRVLKVDGKALRLRDTLDVEDPEGNKLCRIQTRLLHIRDTMVIEDPDGHQMAKVHKALITPLRERWKIDVENGDRVLRVDGKALRLRNTLDVEDLEGNKVCRIQTRVLHIRDTMEIERPDGSEMAKVHKALITPLRERWKVDVEDGEDMEVQGNIVDHEYDLEADGRKVAEVSKKWFRVADTYGVQVAPDADTLLVLCVAVALDVMGHPAR